MTTNSIVSDVDISRMSRLMRGEDPTRIYMGDNGKFRPQYNEKHVPVVQIYKSKQRRIRTWAIIAGGLLIAALVVAGIEHMLSTADTTTDSGSTTADSANHAAGTVNSGSAMDCKVLVGPGSKEPNYAKWTHTNEDGIPVMGYASWCPYRRVRFHTTRRNASRCHEAQPQSHHRVLGLGRHQDGRGLHRGRTFVFLALPRNEGLPFLVEGE